MKDNEASEFLEYFAAVFGDKIIFLNIKRDTVHETICLTKSCGSLQICP